MCKTLKQNGLTFVVRERSVLEVAVLVNEVTVVVNCYEEVSPGQECCKSEVSYCSCVEEFVRI
jgi:hypothetical protein